MTLSRRNNSRGGGKKMKLTLAEPKYLKESISIISEIVAEGRFKITGNSIELVATDPANVCIIIFKLLSSTFVEYKLDKDIEIKLNLIFLKQILRHLNPNDMLTLEFDETQQLRIILKSKSVRTFNLPIIELDEKQQKVPELKFPVSVTLPPAMLSSAIAVAEIFAESLSFSIEQEKFVIQAEGDLSNAKIEMKEDTLIELSAGSEKVMAEYSIEYLKKMINSKLANEVTVRFNKNYPLKLEYNVVNKMFLGFILAPRVEND